MPPAASWEGLGENQRRLELFKGGGSVGAESLSRPGRPHLEQKFLARNEPASHCFACPRSSSPHKVQQAQPCRGAHRLPVLAATGPWELGRAQRAGVALLRCVLFAPGLPTPISCSFHLVHPPWAGSRTTPSSPQTPAHSWRATGRTGGNRLFCRGRPRPV